MPNATPCHLPPESRLRDSLPRMDYLDSFEVPSRTPEQDVVAIYAAALGHLPKVFKQLLVVRSYLAWISTEPDLPNIPNANRFTRLKNFAVAGRSIGALMEACA